MPALKIAILTAITMLAVAANSVLARLALSDGDIDPLTYTGIRLASGALILAIIFRLRSQKEISEKFWIAGTWPGALSLLLYAVTFSLAYVMVGAGPGALILFASVQIAMVAWAIIKGDRPAPLEWIGIGIAFGSLVYLLSPGLVAPSLSGALLTAIAGVSWGAYCLIGRGSRFPLAPSTRGRSRGGSLRFRGGWIVRRRWSASLAGAFTWSIRARAREPGIGRDAGAEMHPQSAPGCRVEQHRCRCKATTSTSLRNIRRSSRT